MAAPLLFYDLSLLPSSSSGSGDDNSNTSSSSPGVQLLAATARALELGYAAVALDHPHRGLLADSHRCRTHPFPPLSSLPLPSSAALHRRCPASEPFRQYTRITLSLDSAATAASALAPSTARLLRTYDLVAARPLTQAAFDHLCQAPLAAQHLDLISIDFSSHAKLPFRIKLPMLKLALQKGLHFEIAYSPLISTDTNAKRNLLAEVKDAMDVDATESRRLNLIVGDNIPSTSSTSVKFACSALPHGIELSATSLEDPGPCQSGEILADLDQSSSMQVDAETYRGSTSEPVECPPSGVHDEAPLDLAFRSSHKLHSDVIIQQRVMEEKIEQDMDQNIERMAENETESIDEKMEPAFHGQEIRSTSYKRSTDASCESDELKEQNSEEIDASLEKSVAKTHEVPPKFSYPSGKVEMFTIRSGKI
ncbi:unnamed protein product [Urochloa decumbens]|uniref:Uncharacterized protein n=1 Tax=Urochloa decumbens TaxID=240449 RepID=A0ABC8W8B5_9POAL